MSAEKKHNGKKEDELVSEPLASLSAAVRYAS
jgi:hypothetical protein